MRIILSTRNPSKAEQIKAVFTDSPFIIHTLDDAGIAGEAVEDGETLNHNALKKARFAHEQLDEKTWTMADDTGIFINALNGLPGVRAARWAGEHATTEEIMQHTLNQLSGADDRSAYFETVVAVISPDGTEYFFSGKVHGALAVEPQAPFQPKMPYSPLFVPHGQTKSWAEMTVEEVNKISHRGIAFRAVREFLENLLSQK